MATRGNIGLLRSNGSVRRIYTHWDSYPAHHGPILLKNFDTVEKVNALLDLGDLSILDESIEKPEGHTFDTPVDGHCIAYGRDRGEEGTAARELTSKADAVKGMEEYLYLFDEKKGKWIFTENGMSWMTLTSDKDVKKWAKETGFPLKAQNVVKSAEYWSKLRDKYQMKADAARAELRKLGYEGV